MDQSETPNYLNPSTRASSYSDNIISLLDGIEAACPEIPSWPGHCSLFRYGDPLKRQLRDLSR